MKVQERYTGRYVLRCLSMICLLVCVSPNHTLAAPAVQLTQSATQSVQQRVRYSLDVVRSPVNITLRSGPILLSGTFRLTSGEWNGTPQDPQNSEVRLSGNLKDLKLDPLSGWNLQGISNSLPHKAAMFQSTSISRAANGLFNLEGVISVDGRSYRASLPIKVGSEKGELVVTMSRDGVIEEWPSQIPLPVAPGLTEGEVQATLRFKRQ